MSTPGCTTTKAPKIGVRVTVEKFFGPSRIFKQIDIHCADANSADEAGDLLIGMVETEKRSMDAAKPEESSNAGG